MPEKKDRTLHQENINRFTFPNSFQGAVIEKFEKLDT